MSSQSSNNRVGQQGRFQEVICTQVPTRSWQLACDGFGNLAARTGTGTAQSTTISTPTNATTNQLSGYSYDANGNQISTGYSYDVENRMSFANGGGVQYFYDAQNKRVWQASCTTSGYCTPGPGWVLNLNQDTVNLFGADGKQLASYQAGGAWNPSGGINVAMGFSYTNTRVYFGGRLVGQQVGTNGYLAVIQDRLGSVGKYYPYGEERNAPQLPNDQVKFATYTRDSATGNDYADQRYYTSVLGRFMTPDLVSGQATNPQSWNRYNYGIADPINYRDPKGLFVEPPDPGPEPDPQQPSPRPQPLPKDPPNANSPFPECNKSGSPTEDKNLEFIADNYDDAAAIGKKYGVPTDWVLGWAAEESGYGHVDPQASIQNNFYNESLPKNGVTGGWAGAVPCPANAVAGWACFNSFYDSANAALNKVGQTIANILSQNPTDSIADVFQAINNIYHWDTGDDASRYGQKIQNVISGNASNLDKRIDCLKKNGYI